MTPVDTLLDPFCANELAFKLNADPEDDWTFEVEARGKYSVVRICDETGEFVGCL